MPCNCFTCSTYSPSELAGTGWCFCPMEQAAQAYRVVNATAVRDCSAWTSRVEVERRLLEEDGTIG